MKLAIVAAGFTPDEANGLRRAMATFRNVGTIHQFEAKMVEGMVERGYERDFAERCFNQIKGFGSYGFPGKPRRSRFAKLVYVSAWIKCHHPAVFACALLNSQPMGFYAPAQMVRDAREHGVEVRAVDINASDWDNSLERGERWRARASARLSPDRRLPRGLGRRAGRGARRRASPIVEELAQRAGLPSRALAAARRCRCLRSIGLDRREALWEVRRTAARACCRCSPRRGAAELGRGG